MILRSTFALGSFARIRASWAGPLPDEGVSYSTWQRCPLASVYCKSGRFVPTRWPVHLLAADLREIQRHRRGRARRQRSRARWCGRRRRRQHRRLRIGNRLALRGLRSAVSPSRQCSRDARARTVEPRDRDRLSESAVPLLMRHRRQNQTDLAARVLGRDLRTLPRFDCYSGAGRLRCVPQ